MSLVHSKVRHTSTTTTAINLTTTLTSVLVVIMPPIVSKLIKKSHDSNILRAFQFDNQPVKRCITRGLLLNAIPITKCDIIVLLITTEIVNIASTKLVTFALATAILFYIFAALNTLLANNGIIVNVLISIIMLTKLTNSEFILA